MFKALAFFLCVSVAHAEDLKLGIQEFNFTYQAPQGLGTATSFTHNMKSLREPGIKVEVEKIDEVFKFHVTGSETQDLEFKDAPAFIKDAESMVVESLNFNLQDTLNLSLLRGQFIGKDDELDLDKLSLNCTKDQSQTRLEDKLISGCIQSMELKAAAFASESKEKDQIVSAFSNALLKATGEKGNLGIKKLDLTSKSGKFNLSAEIKAQVSGKAKAKGTLAYDASVKTVTVRIDEVKFGILSVTGMVFDELEKSESEKLIVKKPYVYLILK